MAQPDPVLRRPEFWSLASRFVTRQARPLERARWRVLFEGAPAADVVDVLGAYQNPDGGFGHALEPDFWNPESSPIQTWVAVEVLREAGWWDPGHPLAQGLLAWLQTQLQAGTGLPTVVPGNNDHPHAPWWAYDAAGAHSNHSEWNPQAALVGFAWARSGPGTPLQRRAETAVVRAAAEFAERGPTFDPHVIACFGTLADEVEASGRRPPFDLEALNRRLNDAAEAVVEPDSSRWFSQYCCRPSQLVQAPHPRWSSRLIELAHREARLLPDHQDEEGAWPVSWSWGAYPEAWPVARAWWRGVVAVQNTRFLHQWTEG